MTATSRCASIQWIDDPEDFHRKNAPELTWIGADAFGQRYEVMADQVATRFAKAAVGQVIRVDGVLAGFCLYDRLPGPEGHWAIEGRATRTAYQGMGLGMRAFAGFLDVTRADIVTSVTRNPAVCRLMAHHFEVSLPDLRPSAHDPLWPLKRRGVSDAMRRYADHLDVSHDRLPILENRYPSGLYGVADPGKGMPLPDLANHPEHGMIAVGVGRQQA
ncbi:GNAT family N-acetyltransferase [Streptomyces sp. NBRC 110028]|uniref:GNAT family N-acetyltransferase n=1 Tax=Streptomyces sp. NBRC 110028 TaxID=1621260 RepID=UPI0006E2ADCB|nr:GNAT family N-acetyltransferase [Streptomyces sp. NBRC 110028]